MSFLPHNLDLKSIHNAVYNLMKKHFHHFSHLQAYWLIHINKFFQSLSYSVDVDANPPWACLFVCTKCINLDGQLHLKEGRNEFVF